MQTKALAFFISFMVPLVHGSLVVTNHQANCGAQLFGGTNVPVGGTGSDDVSLNANGAIKITSVNDKPCKQAQVQYFTKTKCSSTETGTVTKKYTLTNNVVCVNLPSDGTTKCVKVSCSLY